MASGGASLWDAWAGARPAWRLPGRGRCAAFWLVGCGLWRLAEQVVQSALNVEVLALHAGRDDLVGPAEEVRDLADQCLEVRMAGRRGQLDVQQAAGRAVGGAG